MRNDTLDGYPSEGDGMNDGWRWRVVKTGTPEGQEPIVVLPIVPCIAQRISSIAYGEDSIRAAYLASSMIRRGLALGVVE